MNTEISAARKWRMSLLERTHGTQRGYIRRGIFGNGDAGHDEGLVQCPIPSLVPIPDGSVFHWKKTLFQRLVDRWVEIASNAITLKIGGAEWETSCRICALLSANYAVHRHLPSLRCFRSLWESAPPRPFSAWSMAYWWIPIRIETQTGWCTWNCAKRTIGAHFWL